MMVRLIYPHFVMLEDYFLNYFQNYYKSENYLHAYQAHFFLTFLWIYVERTKFYLFYSWKLKLQGINTTRKRTMAIILHESCED